MSIVSGGGAPSYRGGLTDQSIGSLSGSSQSLLTASGSRSYVLVHNPGTADIGITIAATAAIGSGGTLTIAPGGAFVWEGTLIATNAFNVIGTAGQAVTCWVY